MGRPPPRRKLIGDGGYGVSGWGRNQGEQGERRTTAATGAARAGRAAAGRGADGARVAGCGAGGARGGWLAGGGRRRRVRRPPLARSPRPSGLALRHGGTRPREACGGPAGLRGGERVPTSASRSNRATRTARWGSCCRARRNTGGSCCRSVSLRSPASTPGVVVADRRPVRHQPGRGERGPRRQPPCRGRHVTVPALDEVPGPSSACLPTNRRGATRLPPDWVVPRPDRAVVRGRDKDVRRARGPGGGTRQVRGQAASAIPRSAGPDGGRSATGRGRWRFRIARRTRCPRPVRAVRPARFRGRC